MHILFLGLILFIFVSSSNAANHYVFAGSTCSVSCGNDWNNAYTTLPASLTRGDTYYIGDGTYSSHTFADACTPNASACDNTTPIINIKKAISTDHGTDTGWNISTMGSGQAIFTGGFITNTRVTGSITIDGQIAYGIKATFLDAGTGFFFGTSANYVTVKYIDFSGPGGASGFNFTTSTRAFDATPSSGTVNNFLISHCALHGGDTLVQTTNSSDSTVEYSLLYDNGTCCGSTQHPNVWWDGGGVRNSFRFNQIYNTQAEGIFWTCDGCTLGATSGQTNWKVYGNIFRDFVASGRAIEARQDFIYPGPMLIYNNSFVNGAGNTALISILGTITGWDVQNNIFYNGNPGIAGVVPGMTHDYNWTSGTSLGEAHGIFGGTNPFVDYTNKDFHLAAGSSPINAGNNLGSTYSIDFDGNTRGADGFWDMGVYEFGASSPKRKHWWWWYFNH